MTSPVNSIIATAQRPRQTPPVGTFSLWASSYDSEPNPLLGLEQRFLQHLLPPARGLDVVDLGCGTGRWLERILQQAPASLTGIDTSAEMLDRASAKLGHAAQLYRADCAALPLDNCADLILASFVISYIDDLYQFAAEAKRIARPGATIFLSDLHPDTARSCNWKRSFRAGDISVELPAYSRSLHQIVSCFENLGFAAASLLELPFGTPEEAVLTRAGKHHVFQETAGRPAIYLIQFDLPRQAARTAATRDHIAISGSRIAIAAQEAVTADFSIEGGRVTSLGPNSHPGYSSELDLTDYLVLPGLINSHDHLEFGLFPNLGHGLYPNAESWAREIQHSDAAEIAHYRRIPRHVHVWWGAVRNLLAGVTTVCHHNPLTPEMLADDFPVRVVSNFGWAHSLAFEPDIAAKFRAIPRTQPFVLHAAEGCDDTSKQEIFKLDRHNLLDDRTVLVHALGDDAITLLNRRGASVIWCPSSNQFLFGCTHTREFLDSVKNIVLGSDSPLTAVGDLLDEIQLAQSSAAASPGELYDMLLTRPPRIFRLTAGECKLRPGCVADFIAISDDGANPADRIASLRSDGIHLVVLGGHVHLASDALIHRIPKAEAAKLTPLQVDGRTIWLRGPVAEMFSQAAKVLGPELSLSRKRIRYVDAN